MSEQWADRLSDLYQGNPIKCTEEEYKDGLRTAIQNFAGKMIDDGQGVRAVIALEEVKRLDKMFNVSLLEVTHEDTA